jgi:hypothetical protein
MTPRVRNIVGICSFLATWQLLASLGVINALLLPSPLRVIEATLELLADGSLLRHVLASLDRVLIGFLLAAASFAYRIDMWDADGENIIEHLAGVEDLQFAKATYLAPCKRWPWAPITLCQGTRVIEDNRRIRLA